MLDSELRQLYATTKNIAVVGLSDDPDRPSYQVAKYLKEKDIPEDVIHPLFVINKVPITDNERLGITFDPKVSLKLSRLGALYLSELTDASTINHINHHFDYEGRRFRSVVFPELSSIKDGKFSLFQGHTLQLQQYPHLVEMAKSHHYNFPNENDPQTRVYTFSLQQMVNFIKAQAAERPLHNYVKRRIVTPISKLKSDSISALRRAIENYYNTGEVVYTDIVTKSNGGSSAEEWLCIPKAVTRERVIDAVYYAQKQITPDYELDYDEVAKSFKPPQNYRDESEFKIYDNQSNLVVGIEYDLWTDPTRIRILIPKRDDDYHRENRPLTTKNIMPLIDVFLSYLDRGVR